MKKITVLLLSFCMIFSLVFCYTASAATTTESDKTTQLTEDVDPVLAFPGAEGGGKYTKGARGVLDNEGGKVEVYHVTNLNNEGPGSFIDAISEEGRIIVFDVGGIIEIPATLRINKNNLTILGQTAPGDGITITGGDIRVGDGIQNIILRYMRIRPTNKNGVEVDGLGGQWNTDIIFDHCSASWCIDECLTLYAGSAESSTYEQAKRITVQNTISSESLRMSGHFKGAHGYGGIIGGTNATYYRNLFAHHDSRSPRLDRVLQKTDFRNNIVYNWGVTNSAYGGEPTSPHNQVINPSKVNYSNNYYKFGPSTVSGKRFRIFDFSGLAKTVNGVTYKSQFYMTDNYVSGSSTVTNDNWAKDGVNSAADQVEKMSVPFSLGDDVYPDLNISSDKLLAGANVLSGVIPDVGATLPKRDSIDARVIADTKNQTGRIINNEEEVGGLSDFGEASRTFEIPSDWKAANGMTSDMNDADIITSGEKAGYTWIEAYINDWTAEQSAVSPTNPTVTVTSPAIAAQSQSVNGQTVNNGNWSVIKDTDTINYVANATPVGDTTITKMELYDDETLIKTYEGSSTINDSISLGIGTHYLSCVAYNDKNERTRSTSSIVYVNGSSQPSGWTEKQIGLPMFSGKGASSLDSQTGIYTMGGSGNVGSTADKFDFMYKEVTGDFDISLKMEDIPANENGPNFGLMLRETLDAGSRMAMLSDGWIKFGRNDRILARTTKNKALITDSENSNSTDNKIGIFMRGKEGEIVSGNVLGEHPYDTTAEGKYHLPNYLRIQRSGDKLVFSVSDSGTDWTDNARQPYTMSISGLADKLYVGVAVDSHQGQSDSSPKAYYSQVQYSNLSLKSESNIEPDPDATATPSPTPTAGSAFPSYEDWKIGQTGPSTTDGAATEVEYMDKTAINITSRNIYTTLNDKQNSGVVSFNTDLYVNPTDSNGFRIYLENDKASNYQDSANSTGGVFAEVVNSTSGSFCTGPNLGTTSAAYMYSDGTAGWYNINISIDYSKESTADDFITLTIKDASGTEVLSKTMPAITGVDTSLKQVRLVARSIQPYFANMTFSGIVIPDKDNAVYVKDYAPIENGTGSVTIKNTTDASKELTVIIAQYDTSEKEITKVDYKTGTIESGSTQAFEFNNLNQQKARVYIWDGSNISPYSNSFTLTSK